MSHLNTQHVVCLFALSYFHTTHRTPPQMPSPTKQEVLIPCTVTEGMFSSEVAVQIDTGDITVSLFVHNSLIEDVHGESHLRVYYAGDNGKPDHRTVLLPTEAFETGSRWLSVPEKNIQLVPVVA